MKKKKKEKLIMYECACDNDGFSLKNNMQL